MNSNNLAKLIIDQEPYIKQAIATGGAWEIWMQVALTLHLINKGGFQASREVPYLNNRSLKLDILLHDKLGNKCAIELKVESATNAGEKVISNIKKDVTKIAKYTQKGLVERWVVGITYSAKAASDCARYAQANQRTTTFKTGKNIAVLIVSVPLK